MWRYTKTHIASIRQGLSEGQLTSGRGLIHQDLLAQVITPALLHAGDDIGALPVDKIGTQESVVYKCLRKARASGRLSNGGLGPTNPRSFQGRRGTRTRFRRWRGPSESVPRSLETITRTRLGIGVTWNLCERRYEDEVEEAGCVSSHCRLDEEDRGKAPMTAASVTWRCTPGSRPRRLTACGVDQFLQISLLLAMMTPSWIIYDDCTLL